MSPDIFNNIAYSRQEKIFKIFYVNDIQDFCKFNTDTLKWFPVHLFKPILYILFNQNLKLTLKWPIKSLTSNHRHILHVQI